jgi:hypothetical protein
LGVLFDWFEANGGTNRPIRGTPNVPGVNTRIGDRLKSPNSREITVGVTRRLGSRGAVRVDGVFRDFRDFYSTRTDLGTGQVRDQFGRAFDLQITENTDEVERTYKGMNVQASYRILGQLNLGGNYTLGFLEGNFEGETGASGPGTAIPDFYPEYKLASWNYPTGALLGDVRHKMRLWSVWDLPVPEPLGKFNLSGLLFYSSGTPYFSQSTLIDSRPYVTPNPGYATPPSTVTYFFAPRDERRTADLWRADFAFNWTRRLGYRNSAIFLRARVLNAFNRSELTNFFDVDCGTGGCIDTTIQANRNNTSLARFNPFTEQPVEGVHWRRGNSYGQATRRFGYQTPRTFDISVGIRF